MQHITLYTKPNCQPCNATKRKLEKHGLEYTPIDITQDEAAYARVKELGALSSPVVELADGTWWDSYRPSRIEALLD